MNTHQVRNQRTFIFPAIALLTLLVASIAMAFTLPQESAEELQHMALDEKLAQDVYLTLAELYDAPTFTSIAASEAQHLEAVRGLLDRYGIEDPTAGTTIGEFVDPTFAALYTDLVTQGTESIEAAAGVGIAIEELDIADLARAIEANDNADVKQVLGNLLSASENHLAAFQALEANPDAATVGARPEGRGAPQAGQHDAQARGNSGAHKHAQVEQRQPRQNRQAPATAPQRGRGG